MTSLITSNTRRLGRASVALILAVAALVWLLSTWASLPTAEARGPAEANAGSTNLLLSSRSILTSWVFLPILFKTDVVFADDFSSTSSGWMEGKFDGWSLDEREYVDDACEWDLTNGRYRVKVSERNVSCMMPNFGIPRQFNGTFKIRMRRTSDADRLLYGFVFDAAPNATDKDGTRWFLEIYPKNDSNCNNKPFFWLTAQKAGIRKFFNADQSPDKHECTSIIDTDEDEWNEVAVVRDGRRVKVYIKDSQGNYVLKGDYDNVPSLDSDEQNKLGYFLLRIVSLTSDDIEMEFDDLEIRKSTSAP